MRYQKEIERLEKDNRELRKQLILREQRTGKRRVMKVGFSDHGCFRMYMDVLTLHTFVPVLCNNCPGVTKTEEIIHFLCACNVHMECQSDRKNYPGQGKWIGQEMVLTQKIIGHQMAAYFIKDPNTVTYACLLQCIKTAVEKIVA